MAEDLIFDYFACVCEHTIEEHDEDGCTKCNCPAGWEE